MSEQERENEFIERIRKNEEKLTRIEQEARVGLED